MPTIDAVFERPVPPLRPNEAHLWRFGLPDAPNRLPDFWPLLDVAEQGRARRFRHPAHQHAYVACRGALRWLLGKYLAEAPEKIRFALGFNDKPQLANAGGPALHFNISHTAGMALFAFSGEHEIGVDVETIGQFDDWPALAERILSPCAVRQLNALPEAERLRAFYRAWVRKEAILKATGQGLVEALGEIEVTFAPAEPARVVSLWGKREAAGAWWLAEPEVPANFAAALALQGPAPRLLRLA